MLNFTGNSCKKSYFNMHLRVSSPLTPGIVPIRRSIPFRDFPTILLLGWNGTAWNTKLVISFGLTLEPAEASDSTEFIDSDDNLRASNVDSSVTSVTFCFVVIVWPVKSVSVVLTSCWVTCSTISVRASIEFLRSICISVRDVFDSSLAFTFSTVALDTTFLGTARSGIIAFAARSKTFRFFRTRSTFVSTV